MADGETKVVENPQERRFEAHVDGDPVGSAHYRVRRDSVIFTHTEVDDAYEGKGVPSPGTERCRARPLL